jgi:hypothetical protein
MSTPVWVRIQQRDIDTFARQGRTERDSDQGFPYATFAAGKRQHGHPGLPRTISFGQCRT